MALKKSGLYSSLHTTVYDPTCGSGSLLLKVSDQASHDRPAGQRVRVTPYGQEKDNATAGHLRKMGFTA